MTAAGATGGQALRAGQRVRGYRVLVVLYEDEFAITYRADHRTLGDVALKEYFPKALARRVRMALEPNSTADWAHFAWGLKRFQDEGKALARVRHPNITRTLDYFEHGNTGYLATDYEAGLTLADVLYRRGGTLEEQELTPLLLPLADGLRQVHGKGFRHGDVRPQNVVVRRSDKSPLLVNFAGARLGLGHRSGSLDSIATAGYAAPELYGGDGEWGPWTDIYALSAIGYAAVVGVPPRAAPERAQGGAATTAQPAEGADDDQPQPRPRRWSLRRLLARAKPPPPPPTPTHPDPERLPESVEGYSRPLLEIISRGLSMDVRERPQDIDDWLRPIGSVATSDGSESKDTPS